MITEQKQHERRGCSDARSYEEAFKDLLEGVAEGGEDAYPLP